MQLTGQQKIYIENNYRKYPDIKTLTQKAFRDKSLDGRSKEASLVKAHLSKIGQPYKTTKKSVKKSVKSIILTPAQKESIVNLANEGLNSLKIAELIFPEVKIKKLCAEQKVIITFLKEYAPETIKPHETALSDVFEPPEDKDDIMDLIDISSGQKMDRTKLKSEDDEKIDSLRIYLKSPRLIKTINAYGSKDHRDLFLYEFINATWNKTDLTPEDINLYINVCIDYVNLKNISFHMEKLNEMLDDADEQQELTVKLAELLTTKSTEYNQCEKRIESLLIKLNTSRAERMKNIRENNATIIALTNAFKQEDERDRMLKIADMQRELVMKEADRFERMPDWKARVLGIRKSEL
jgi:hypothetical protein